VDNFFLTEVGQTEMRLNKKINDTRKQIQLQFRDDLDNMIKEIEQLNKNKEDDKQKHKQELSVLRDE